MKKDGVIAVMAVVIVIFTALNGCIGNGEKKVVKIFHAGSLEKPLGEIEKLYEEKHSNVDIRREASGSVDAVRKITDAGKKADIVALADYSLIEDMMYPKYAKWGLMFARNTLVVAYTSHSKYADEINSSNWPQILMRDGVTFGFSDPNADPCGYRSIMVIKLAEEHYNISGLFENLVEKHTSITQAMVNGTWYLRAPEDLSPDDKVIIRPKEIDLMALLETGGLDYLFIYRSVAYQHRDSGVKYITLPEEINLGNVSHAGEYAHVKVIQRYGSTGEHTVSGKPIVYGLAITTIAENEKDAEDFIVFLLSPEGRDVFERNGQEFIYPPMTFHEENIPDRIKEAMK